MPDSPLEHQDLTADVQQLTTVVQHLRQEIKKMSEDNERRLQTLMSTIEVNHAKSTVHCHDNFHCRG